MASKVVKDSRACLLGETVLTVSRECLGGVGVLAAMDRGCTLTKLIFSTANDDVSLVNLHFALFKNSDFNSALLYLRENGLMAQQPGAAMHVTGVGCDKYRREIKQELGVDLKFINEGLTHGLGLHWLLKNAPHDFMFYPNPNRASELEAVTSSYVKSINTVNIECETPNEDFPCVLLSMGSGAGIFKVDENGAVKQESTLWFAGTIFLGLCQALINTDNYDEIMELASLGDRSSVDLQVKDVLANDPDSPYGQFPPEIPIYTLGKFVGSQMKIGDASRADVARSLLHGFVNNAVRTLALAAKATRVGRALFGGNFFRHELPRKEAAAVAEFVVGNQLRIEFLRTGHTGAVGAMLANLDKDDSTKS